MPPDVYGALPPTTLKLLTTSGYTYDVFGQKIADTVTYPGTEPPDVESRVYVNERGQRVTEFAPVAGQPGLLLVRRQLWAPGVDQLLAVETVQYDAGGAASSEKVIWTLADQQGTVRDLYSETTSGENVEHLEYDPFGRPLFALMAADGTHAYDISTFYAGREIDPLTGLYYNRARWYDPLARRFIGEDPIPSDTNPYRYVGNSPTNATDPSGRFAEWLLQKSYSGESIYGVVPTDSWIGGFYASAGSALASVNPDFFANASAGTPLAGTAAASTALVLGGWGIGALAGVGGTLGAVGSTTGLATGLLQAYAANPNASFAEYAISGGFSWAGGAFMPGSGVGGLIGTLGGAYGGQYLPGVWVQRT